MRRIPTLIFSTGLGLLIIGALFVAIAGTHPTQAAFAALPEDHPPLPAPDARHGGARVLSTRADFFVPGTQPNPDMDRIVQPFICSTCHSGYSEVISQPNTYEPWTGWQGSMMAQAGRDPVFYAALDIAGADAQLGGDFCLRCHLPRAWLEGRIVNGSLVTDPQETPIDLEGVQCEVCHRLVDPVYTPENPIRDLYVLSATLTSTIPVTPVNGAMVFDPEDYRRGPFDFTEVTDNLGFDPHFESGGALSGTLESPFHQESALCGTCHDISNPLLGWDEAQQTYLLNPLGEPFTDTARMFPIERTYSEWLLSDYNTDEGVFAPEFGGNLDFVSSCQDCHMRTVTGIGGSVFGNTDDMIVRDDLSLHDFSGANTWVPQIIPEHPVFSATFNTPLEGPRRREALTQGITRSRYMLQNAAALSTQYDIEADQLSVTVVNNSGHKLPTGYVEGRRMWLQIEAYDGQNNLIYSSGAYDSATAELTQDGDLQIYESQHGLTPAWASQLGLPPGESFHFVLNNIIVKDNRIPPRGYDYDAFASVGAEPRLDSTPAPDRYADGQYWDVVRYDLPAATVYGKVRLLYQTSSKAYIEFLRDENPNGGDPNNNGEILYDLWQESNRSAPEIMAEVDFTANGVYLPAVTTP